MARTVAIGIQSFDKIRDENYFYIDKTDFIREWWESGDEVTLITRPRRFGKTLNMSMLEQFFSVKYEGRSDLFEDLSIWQEEKYRQMQGTYPVISLSFASVKERDYASTIQRICQIVAELYNDNRFLLEGDFLSEEEKGYFNSVSDNMPEVTASMALHRLSKFLCRYYGKKVIILLDEYDTPMQEAYVCGYWREMAAFTRSLFNATFKTNPYLERGVMTGVTRISKESIFSDLNNLKVVTTTSGKYGNVFGFTEEEVFNALDYYGMGNEKDNVKKWYDGFTFGNYTDIYNPWSITNLLDEREFHPYWADTSSNSLIASLIRQANPQIKQIMESLLTGGTLMTQIDEQIVFDQLDYDENAIWSLMLASGYLKVVRREFLPDGEMEYELAITNMEVLLMFRKIIRQWFQNPSAHYNDFVRALMANDVKAMNHYMNKVALQTISYFDVGNKPSEEIEPEHFYHGFVLGLIVELKDRYRVVSNRESGFGRYDIVLEPINCGESSLKGFMGTAMAYVLEFKVYDGEEEKDLRDTVDAALRQIMEKQYDAELVAKGISRENIRHYGFAFRGKEVLIGADEG